MLQPKPVRPWEAVRLPRVTPRGFWATVGLIWAALVVALAVTSAPAFAAASTIEAVALVIVIAASSALWLGGVRSLAMWAAARMTRRPGDRAPWPAALPTSRVALVSCAADDFNPAALRRSIAQRRAVTVVILDDSRSEAAMRAVDVFAEETGAEVLRRSDRRGFKAGNLNAGIRRIAHRFDHLVLLDSDDVLPPDFVDRALARFAANPTVGIVQAAHVAWRGESAFTAEFSGLLGTHIAVTQSARSAAGFSMFMGRGAMVSVEAYRAAGGMPELVMEDIAFSFEVREAGYRIAYAPEIVCTEDYPVDYAAFRSQHHKLIEGTTEFLRGAWRRIAASRLRWHEKVDLVFEQLMIPFGAVVGLALLGAGALLHAAGGDVGAPAWAGAVTGVSVSAALLPEAARRLRRDGVVAAARFTVLALALYGSVLVLTVRAAVTVALGAGAAFRVTPKTRGASGWRSTARMLRAELIVAATAIALGVIALGSVLPLLALIVPVAAAFLLDALASRPAPPRARPVRAALRLPVPRVDALRT